MANGIWVTPTQFLDFSEQANVASLKEEIAYRANAWDYSGLVGLLPDPDPILSKRGDGMEILESLTADPHLLSVMQSRRLGVMTNEYRWEPGTDEDGEVSSQAEQLCRDFVRDANNVIGRDQISQILDAPFFGMAPMELTFEPDTHIRLKKVDGKPARWFGYDEENVLRFRSQENQEDGEPVPWGKFVVARHFPTYDNPYGLRLLTRCFWPITFKKGGLKFWVSYMEKFGMPFLLGHYSRGTQPKEQGEFLAKLERMVRSAVAVVPDGDRIEMLGGSGKTGGGHLTFSQMKSVMDAEISKVILGQTLTTEAGEKGSYGLGKVHGEVLSDFQESDKLLTKETLDEIAEIYAKLNADGVPAPTCTFFEKEDPKKDFADRDKVLEESGRLRFKKAYYVRRYDLQEDDFELVDVEPSPEFAQGKKAEEYNSDDDPLSGSNQIKRASFYQAQLDSDADDFVSAGADIFGGYKKQIREWLGTFDDMQAAIDALPDMLNMLSSAELENSLFSALVSADATGQNSVPQEDDFADVAWGGGKAFTEALDYFKAKSFTIAGHSQADLLGAVKDELIKRMESGGSLKEFRNALDEIFISRGYDPLSNHHIETIYRTNMQTAFTAGRYAQLTKPSTLKARPYWKYVTVRDGNTRPAHREMHGKIFHHDNPIWRIWYPPNGFNCRCHVVSVSSREIERDGLEVENSDISGSTFDVVNEQTGEIKTHVLDPDNGWGGAGGKLEAMMKKIAKGQVDIREWTPRDNMLDAVSLGRPAVAAIDKNQWLEAGLVPRLEKLQDNQLLTEKEAIGQFEDFFKKEFAISPLETQAVIRAHDGAAVTVTVESLARLMATRADHNEQYLYLLRKTIENPYEIMLGEYETPGGKTKYRRKYLGLYQLENNTRVMVVGEIMQDGSVDWSIVPEGEIERMRTGVQLIYGRGEK